MLYIVIGLPLMMLFLAQVIIIIIIITIIIINIITTVMVRLYSKLILADWQLDGGRDQNRILKTGLQANANFHFTS